MSTNNANLADTKSETVDTKVLISTERTVLNNSVTINGNNGVGQGFVINGPSRFCGDATFKEDVFFLGPLRVDQIEEATPGAGVSIKPKVKLDQIDECTPLAGVTVMKDLKAQTNVCADSIKELNSGANITMQNTTCFPAGLETDNIDEKTPNGGVLVDGFRIKDGTAFVGDNPAQVIEHVGNKNQPFGYPGLDAAGKVPITSLESQPLIFRGCWDANSNTPNLASGVGNDGDYYLVSVAGTTNLDGYNSWAVGDSLVFKAGAPGSWTQLASVNSVVSVNGQTGVVSLALNDISDVSAIAPPNGSGLYYNGANWVNTPVLRTLDGVAPALPSGNVDLVAGSNITITPGINSITIASTASGAVSLNDAGVAGGHQSLVANSTGPALTTKGMVGGTGITVSSNSTDVTVTNNSPASSVTLSSGGGTEPIVGGDVGDNTGPALVVKGLTAGTGIGLSSNNDAITITNSSPGSAVTLGTPGIIGESLIISGTGPSLTMKRLIGGTNITLTPTGNDITIAAASAGEANTTSSAGGTSLVLPKSGVNLPFKGLTSTGVISLTANANDVQISSSAEANTASSAGGTSLVLPKSGVDLPFKGLTAGQNITLTANANDVNIQSQWIMGAGPSRIYWDESVLGWTSYNNHIKFITGDPGSFTIPLGISKVIVTAMGGGGGGGTGGYGQGVSGGGGGSGYMAMGIYNVVAGDTFTHTIGAGGAGTGGAPNPGGNTTVTYAGAGSAISQFNFNVLPTTGTNVLIAAGGEGAPGQFGSPFNGDGGDGMWGGGSGNEFGSGTTPGGVGNFTPASYAANFFDFLNGNFYVSSETNELFQNSYAPYSGTPGNDMRLSTTGSFSGSSGGGVYGPKGPADILTKAAEFVGSISGTTLTVTSVNPRCGPIHIGQDITGTGVTAGTYITGGSGLVWTVNNSQTVGPITFSATYPTSSFNGTYYEIATGRLSMPILVTSMSAGRIFSGQVLVPNPGNQTRGVWVQFTPDNNTPIDSATFSAYSTTTAGAPPTQTLLANPTTFTLDVVSTAGFPTAGTVIVSTTLGQPVPVTYTSINATQLMGCQTDTLPPGGPYTVNAGSSVSGPVIIARVPNNTYKVTSGSNAHTGRIDIGTPGGGPGAGLPGISVVANPTPSAPNSGAGGSGGCWLDGTGVGGGAQSGAAGWVIYELFK